MGKAVLAAVKTVLDIPNQPQLLLEAGLVDELKLLINPAFAGKGERPFKEDINYELELLELLPFEKNVVLLNYKPTIK
ncbi:dihydrofolate reductase family protein [Chryseolinea lacunae]|uniref:Dihydrofolate reductase family protein n=1 Tax=Chryseolinea lacunae TaxID=2801331 RepID=A0ABS1KZ31_9BACT|nr:dihydrofolate reductase family protein [Chryseolinea lacunae]MBL0744649.1 dihydrofolate reductase family protein [Chryseolinea lacunae]